jgi:thymidylate synthase (FAD)
MGLYTAALEDGIAPEEARYFLPQGIKTKLVVTGNFRAWFEYLPKRLCKRAMPEHRKVAEAILAELKKAAPEIFDRNFMNCGVSCKEKGCEFK